MTLTSYYLILFILISLVSCKNDKIDNETDIARGDKNIEMTTNLIIGLENQPNEYQLGQPIAVRTDVDGNIYIADRASLTIKVFDHNGNYLRDLGGRGKGPGEFQDFGLNLMGITPEGHFAFLDRSILRYQIISTKGEHIESFPYNLSDQFFPRYITYVDGQILGLFARDDVKLEKPLFERDIFHIYSPDFQEKRYSFAPFKMLGFNDMFVWAHNIFYLGSFTMSGKNQLTYSPAFYNGNLYRFQKNEIGQWEHNKIFKGTDPFSGIYESYSSEADYEASEELPGAYKIHYGYDGPHMGRVKSMNAGIFYLGDGRLIQFFAEWRNGDDINSANQYLLDLFVQVFDEDGKVQKKSYLHSIKRKEHPFLTLVNWKDHNDNFYLINMPEDDVPTIHRFSLDL